MSELLSMLLLVIVCISSGCFLLTVLLAFGESLIRTYYNLVGKEYSPSYLTRNFHRIILTIIFVNIPLLLINLALQYFGEPKNIAHLLFDNGMWFPLILPFFFLIDRSSVRALRLDREDDH